MTGPRIEPEQERRARIQRETQVVQAAIREGRLPPEAMQRYIERERITPEMERERTPLTAMENARGMVANAGEGVGFSLADEVMGGARGVLSQVSPFHDDITMSEGIDQVRTERDEYASRNPKAALGLTLGGAVLPAVLTAGASTGANASGQAARVAASGAGGGAIAGYGSGEGGSMDPSRLGRSAAGAVGGYAIGKALPHVLGPVGLFDPAKSGGGQLTDDLLATLGRSASPTAQPAASALARTATAASPTPATMRMAGPPAPRADGFSEAGQRAALRAFGGVEGVRKGRAALDALDAAGMGQDALAMNVGGDLTVRAPRAGAPPPGGAGGRPHRPRRARGGEPAGESGGADGERTAGASGWCLGGAGAAGHWPLYRVRDRVSGSHRGRHAKGVVGQGERGVRRLPRAPRSAARSER